MEKGEFWPLCNFNHFNPLKSLHLFAQGTNLLYTFIYLQNHKNKMMQGLHSIEMIETAKKPKLTFLHPGRQIRTYAAKHRSPKFQTGLWDVGCRAMNCALGRGPAFSKTHDNDIK